MRVLLVLTGPPYGTEATYNGLRLALALSKRDEVSLRVFLIGDAVAAAMSGQKVPGGWYDLERMLGAAARRDADVGCCGTCLDARGITDGLLAKGARRSSMEELADWTCWADKIVSF